VKLGVIGAGSIARALVGGWGEKVVASDGGSGRAAELGERLGSNRAVAEAADVVVLCHKPYQLDAVAGEIRDVTRAVVSALGGTSVAALEDAFPGVPVLAIMPNTPCEVGRGVVVQTTTEGPHTELATRMRPLLERLGLVVELPAGLVGAATEVMGVGPAYLALVLEAQVDAAVRHGLSAPLATELATATMAGTAALLAARDGDTLAVRRGVTSPGGSTARGLAALERHGLRAAFSAAADAVRDG